MTLSRKKRIRSCQVMFLVQAIKDSQRNAMHTMEKQNNARPLNNIQCYVGFPLNYNKK